MISQRLTIASIIIILPFTVFWLYRQWQPGLDIQDGCHNLKLNGIWIQHGWLGDDDWFKRYHKQDLIGHFRNTKNIQKLAKLLRDHHITDVFPHLCPTSPDGEIASSDNLQIKRFLNEFKGFRVMPWVGGVSGVQAFPADLKWQQRFAESIRSLLLEYPQFHGIHINIEPCRTGNKEYLEMLDQVRNALPEGKVLSIAAFPPPTLFHPFPDVHWDENYYKKVCTRVDQVVVMMYDTSLRMQKAYKYIMGSWSKNVLIWSNGTDVLFGLPTYDDPGVGYHLPKVENLENSLLGIHEGLKSFDILPTNYQGVALYCEWEMDESEWFHYKEHFL